MLLFKYGSVNVLLLTTVGLCICNFEEEDEQIVDASKTESVTSEETKESVFEIPNEKWIVNALKDIAYILRNHKFNEWDRRYYKEKPNEELIGFYRSFPVPSLKTIHWKVHENCIRDFYKCITYLHSIIETSPFIRSDDITSIINNNCNKTYFNSTSLTNMNSNCKQALLNIEKTGLPFDGPREKFQWRTSASYYMCWYTMMGTPPLSMLGESCDNFANCLDTYLGYKNRDPRSDDKLAFACAMYSFCPDPCCPLRHISMLSQCLNNKDNPCFLQNKKGRPSDRLCRFDRKQNQNLEGIIANKWNVSCQCKNKGFIWKSQFEMCVDKNECITNEHNCDNLTQDCINLPGTYQCICKLGFPFNIYLKKCVKNDTFMKDSEDHDGNHSSMIDKMTSILKYIEF